MDRPIPFPLIRRIVKLKLKQNLARAAAASSAPSRARKRPSNSSPQHAVDRSSSASQDRR
jgi:hypothetical protein